MNAHAIESDRLDIDAQGRMIAETYHDDPGNLIMILQSINDQCRYLPKESLRLVAERLGLPLSRVYGVATFYKAFSLEPRGEHIVKVCMGTACHVRGAQRVKETLAANMKVHEGGTTADGKFTLETVRCVGCCSLGPVVMIDDEIYSRTDSDKIAKTVQQYH